MKQPFAVPAHLSPALCQVRDYWKSLLRGGAAMPFWDDAKLSDLPALADRLFLLDVFEQPERFRLGTIGAALGSQDKTGVFIDHAELDTPFDFLRSQASATVECAGPTAYVQGAAEGATQTRGYTRLLLPMWGEGRIGMLLGAVDFE
jgi:hypothetical protein